MSQVIEFSGQKKVKADSREVTGLESSEVGIELQYTVKKCDPERLQSALERIYTRLIWRGREHTETN